MEDRDACREAWAGLRMSPLFGCICPNTHMKKRCDRIFALVNHNPCVAATWGECPPAVRALFEPPRRAPVRAPPLTRYAAPDGTILLLTENGTRLMTRAAAASLLRAALLSPRPPRPRHGEPRRANSSLSFSMCLCRIPSPIALHASHSFVRIFFIDVFDRSAGAIILSRRSGSVVEQSEAKRFHGCNSSKADARRTHGEPNWHLCDLLDRRLDTHLTLKLICSQKPAERIGKENGRSDDEKVALQSTCHVALDSCIKDGECMTSLTPVLQKCHAMECDREGCMAALRGFYRKPGVHWNTEIAFCLCKKTDNREDSCMNAQERLHPSCAQRPPVGSPLPACHTLAHACREDAECRYRDFGFAVIEIISHPLRLPGNCPGRISLFQVLLSAFAVMAITQSPMVKNYEQWCAVDAVTQGCAGSPAACRSAVVAVLGTQLRAACACRGTDFAQLYDCLGWQRLLWLNPCVGKFCVSEEIGQKTWLWPLPPFWPYVTAMRSNAQANYFTVNSFLNVVIWQK
ncbi:unnamed protein product [Diatraea saccharalis]|uniref:GDNF/GAS1 domain-containing protein n=1 Tax=Diatraea saccharalis TaxID=40085 RepID=A0A9N9WL98_9NEOP|nr:unnamed protein product [Diatraea saccharalis]